MTSFDVPSGMVQWPKSLTDEGMNAYKRSRRELVQLADLGRRVVSTEQMKEKHRSRLPVVKHKRAA